MTFPPGRSIQHPAETTTPDRIRTCGLLLRRQTLYPAELRARFAMAARPPDLKLSPFGRGKSMAGLRPWRFCGQRRRPSEAERSQ